MHPIPSTSPNAWTKHSSSTATESVRVPSMSKTARFIPRPPDVVRTGPSRVNFGRAGSWLQGVLHVPRRFLGHFPSQQPADDVQAHVDAGGDPRRADHLAVVHEAAA